jgi:hypothetical protein
LLTTNKYIFIGGPFHLETKQANGQHRIQFIMPIFNEPLWTEITDPIPTMDTEYHYYDRKKIDMFGARRDFYVYKDLNTNEAHSLIGALCASLIDLYVES